MLKVTNSTIKTFFPSMEALTTHKIVAVVKRHPWATAFTVGVVALTAVAGLGLYAFRQHKPKPATILEAVMQGNAKALKDLITKANINCPLH
ncbi:MAG: hypothetical protein KDK44_00410, partial [Chlamydiia bacterium]|nr:hypothetical protein [Chlamydiia bacterium]